MRVHQPRKEKRVTEVHDVGGRCAGAVSDIRNAAALDGNDSVDNRRNGDGKNVPRPVADHMRDQLERELKNPVREP